MLVFLIVTSLSAILAEPCTQGLTVVAPRVAVAGRRSSVLVSLHGTAARAPLNVTLRLACDLGAEEETPEILARATALLRGHGLVHLAVPLSAAGRSAVLQVLANCSESEEESEDCALTANTAIHIADRVREIVISSDKSRYRPGDTVEFWLVAVDHELRAPYDVTASVSVTDPNSNIVALWPRVDFNQGVRSFKMALERTATEGSWSIEVKVNDLSWGHVVNVSHVVLGDMSEQAMAEEHYVELRFGHEMRRLYKPGLPFVGKVAAVSTEKNMRVRVKVYDNTTAIYSQDIEITSGEGTFLVPAILADSDVIIFQAELVSVEGKEIDSHYVLAKEPIRKWNSSSDCYILIEGVEKTMKPGEVARAVILSTCPCERDLHVVVTTEGHVTHAFERKVEGPEHPVTSQEIPTQSVDGVAICHINFTFPVSSVMAPVSHLLVYYVTEDGEPVSDVTSFGVQLLMQESALNIEQRTSWLPGESLDAQLVGAQEGDVVCLVGSRAHDPEPKRVVRSKKHAPIPEPPIPAGDLDFQEAGVSLFQRACANGHVTFRQDGGYSHQHTSSLWRDPNSRGEIWMWQCSNYTAAVAAVGLTVQAPMQSGAWSLWAFSLSTRSGLRFSSPRRITVFQPLETTLSLPPSLKVGEAVEVAVKIANNLNSCMDVTALLSLTEGAHFLSNRVLYLTEKLRLGPRGATSLVIRVLATKAGNKNLTAEVSGYHSESCRGMTDEDEVTPRDTPHDTPRDTPRDSANESLVVSVMRTASTDVLAEGLVKTNTESAYFCANENLVVSPAEEFQFEFITAPHTGLVFEVKADSGALIALSESRYVTPKSYLMALGNSESWLGRGRHEYGLHLTSAHTPGLLSPEEFTAFWVSWDRGVAAIGEGHVLNNGTLLQWPLDSGDVTHVGFAAAWGQPAQFRVWSYNEEAGFSQVLHMDVPANLVPGTEQGLLLIAGGLYLPSQATLRKGHEGLHAALNALATLYELRMREATGEAGPIERESELSDVTPRLQRLLSFRQKIGAFGDHPEVPDFRGSVAALEMLAMMQSYIDVDPELMTSLKRWLLSQQREEGSFRGFPELETLEDTWSEKTQELDLENENVNEVTTFASLSQVSPRDSVESKTNDESVYLTGQAVVALIRLGLESEVDTAAVMRARYYLERAVFHVSEPCALALLALALTHAHSDMAGAALDRLRRQASNEEGDFAWPLSDNDTQSADREIREFEASLWALMTYTSMGDLKSAEPVAKFLFYRWALLDTHTQLLGLATRAAAQFSLLGRDVHRQLTISLATSGMELTDTLELRPDTPGPARLLLPGLPTRVFVYSTGAGCATVQGVVSYSTYEDGGGRSRSLLLWASVVNEEVPGPGSLEELEGKQPSVTIRVCVQTREERGVAVRLELQLFSGFELEHVDNKTHTWHGVQAQNAWFVFNKVHDACARCVTVRARGDHVIRSLRPALATAFPVGKPHDKAQLFFHAKRDSPLLSGVAEDDLVTWFGAAHGDMLGSNMTQVDECQTSNEDFNQIQMKNNKNNNIHIPVKTESSKAVPITLETSKYKPVKTGTSQSVPVNTQLSNIVAHKNVTFKSGTSKLEVDSMINGPSVPETPKKNKIELSTLVPVELEGFKTKHNKNGGTKNSPVTSGISKTIAIISQNIPLTTASSKSTLTTKASIVKQDILVTTIVPSTTEVPSKKHVKLAGKGPAKLFSVPKKMVKTHAPNKAKEISVSKHEIYHKI